MAGSLAEEEIAGISSGSKDCTLQEQVEKTLGFKIGLKFDGCEGEFIVGHVERAALQVASDYAKDRPVIFSSFQPDAAKLVRELQSTYPVFFLTYAGNEIHNGERINSLEDAIRVCLEGGLRGIVSELKGVFRAITNIKESNLSLLTDGKLNNVGEAVYMQYVMGTDGLIVGDITESAILMMMIRPPSSDILDLMRAVVFDYAKDRPVNFSSFQPDAAKLVKELKSTYPVFFLTDAGNDIHNGERRNSLEEAIRVCLEGGLRGIVSEDGQKECSYYMWPQKCLLKHEHRVERRSEVEDWVITDSGISIWRSAWQCK